MTPDGNDPSARPNLAVRYGSTVEHNGRRFVITHILDFDAVLAEDAETGERQQLPVAELLPASSVVSKRRLQTVLLRRDAGAMILQIR